jgi:hypothetical protein
VQAFKGLTVGISPKVAWPTLAAIALGTAVVVVGVLIDDATVRDVGIGILATAGVVIAPIGYKADPGVIIAQDTVTPVPGGSQ